MAGILTAVLHAKLKMIGNQSQDLVISYPLVLLTDSFRLGRFWRSRSPSMIARMMFIPVTPR
jgi:hypothetical protein